MFSIHIHLDAGDQAETNNRLDRIEHLLKTLRAGQAQELKMANALDQAIADLQAKVEAETVIEQSALTLINGFPALIQQAIDQAKAEGATAQELNALTELGKKIADSSAQLSAAVVANTPAGPVVADTTLGGAGGDTVAGDPAADTIVGGTVAGDAAGDTVSGAQA